MDLQMPPGVVFATDVAPARWVADALWLWNHPEPPLRIGSLVPPTYEAFVRITGSVDGSLTRSELDPLIDTLASFTSTPQECWFCSWVGFGAWSGGSPLVAVDGLSWWKKASMRRQAHRSSNERRREEQVLPQVAIGEGRSYFLFSGPLTAAPGFADPPLHQSPNIFWPEDRAWCVATEIDGICTYVGASRAGIDALLASSDLRTTEVTALDPFAP
jgi:hypothetical protein